MAATIPVVSGQAVVRTKSLRDGLAADFVERGSGAVELVVGVEGSGHVSFGKMP